MSKYLLCCFFGGYNDQISVIYTCYKYCISVGRILLVYNNCIDINDDINNNHLNSFYRFNLTDYIHFDLDNIIFDNKLIEDILSNIQDNEIFMYSIDNNICIPKKLERYVKYVSNEIDNKIKFIYFYINFEYTLISYYNCGGNYDLDINYLNKFYFKEPIKSLYLNRIKFLPDFYVSFHIRNTDYKCDYKKIFEEHKNLLEHPIYLATDSVEVFEYVKSIAKNKVYQFSTLHSDNKPLHHFNNGIIDNRDRFIELILDLLCVANSNIFVPSVGGFSALCYKYFNNKNLIQFY